ncbi:RidA family protein [Bacteroidota bacterium]
MRHIKSSKIPTPAGHYSPLIIYNGLAYLSGQLPINPNTKIISETIEDQTLQALKNVDLLVEEAGSSKEKILQMRLYISDISLWDRVNAVYKEFFGDHKPVRTVVPVKELHFGCLIEIEAVAVV